LNPAQQAQTGSASAPGPPGTTSPQNRQPSPSAAPWFTETTTAFATSEFSQTAPNARAIAAAGAENPRRVTRRDLQEGRRAKGQPMISWMGARKTEMNSQKHRIGKTARATGSG
jgi:hypothetical protein